MAEIERINPDTLPDAGAIGYSQVTTCTPGKMIFISGQVAWTPAGDPPPEDIADQARLAASNLGKALKAAGAGPEHVVSARAFIVDYTEERGNAAFAPILEFFGGHQTAFTAIGCSALAGPGLQIEIEAIAVV